jgi:hypothetical protein
MDKHIKERLDKIIDLLNKILEKQNSTVSYTTTFPPTNAVGKEYVFPTPWNTPYKAVNPEDKLPE